MFMEYLTKNAKKLVSIAEEFDCPEIIKTAYKYGVINSKNEKTIRKLLIESKVPEISALADSVPMTSTFRLRSASLKRYAF